MSKRMAYRVKSDERGHIHVEFMKIKMVGKETERFYTIQKFWPREFDKMKMFINEFGLGAVGFDAMEVVYDPSNPIEEEKPIEEPTEVKQETKPRGRPPKQKEEK